jgi:transcriptional regulator with XRE-family HTH domain
MSHSPFGYVLKALRVADSLTVEQLAERAQLSPAAVRHIERGFREPSYATAGKLADVLGVGLDAFREGPNQRPVESGHLRDARLAALGRWHKEEATFRRLEQEAQGKPSPATGREPSPQPDSVHQYRCPVCHNVHPVEWRWCPDCLVCHSVDRSPAFCLGASSRPAVAVAAQIAGTEPAAHAADDVAGDDQGDDLFEPRVVEDNPEEPQPAAAELVEPAPTGELTAELLRCKAELHPLDPGDRKAFHQARRRSAASGADGMTAALAGYAAVRRHRGNTRSAEKRPARTAQDRPSPVKPARGSAEKAARSKGRKRGGQS